MPNPFKSLTNFEYNLSYPNKATIELYNLNGQLLSTLLSNKHHEAGKYTLPFNQSLPSGTYIVVIKGTETIASCKVGVLE